MRSRMPCNSKFQVPSSKYSTWYRTIPGPLRRVRRQALAPEAIPRFPPFFPSTWSVGGAAGWEIEIEIGTPERTRAWTLGAVGWASRLLSARIRMRPPYAPLPLPGSCRMGGRRGLRAKWRRSSGARPSGQGRGGLGAPGVAAAAVLAAASLAAGEVGGGGVAAASAAASARAMSRARACLSRNLPKRRSAQIEVSAVADRTAQTGKEQPGANQALYALGSMHWVPCTPASRSMHCSMHLVPCTRVPCTPASRSMHCVAVPCTPPFPECPVVGCELPLSVPCDT
jgi:hypothetical protein